MKEGWQIHKECMYYLSEHLLGIDGTHCSHRHSTKMAQYLMRGYDKRIMFSISHVDQENISTFIISKSECVVQFLKEFKDWMLMTRSGAKTQKTPSLKWV